MPCPRVLGTLSLLAVAGLVAACGSSGSPAAGTGPVLDDGSGGGRDQPSAVGDNDSSRLTAVLSGAAEVPGPGDPDASGRASFMLEPGSSQLCYRIEVQGITGVDGTSVHRGADGEQGAVVLGLDPPEQGAVEGCVTAAPALLEQVGDAPEDYYLNIRSDEHPEGAVRGQLSER